MTLGDYYQTKYFLCKNSVQTRRMLVVNGFEVEELPGIYLGVARVTRESKKLEFIFPATVEPNCSEEVLPRPSGPMSVDKWLEFLNSLPHSGLSVFNEFGEMFTPPAFVGMLSRGLELRTEK